MHKLLALGVESRGRLVKNQELRILQHRTRNAESLTLSTRELRSTVADIGIVTLRALHDKVVGICHLAGRHNLLIRCVGTAKCNVALDSVVEEYCLLRHKAHRRTQRVLLVITDRNAIKEDIALVCIVESLHQLAQCGLSATRRANQGNCFALTHL